MSFTKKYMLFFVLFLTKKYTSRPGVVGLITIKEEQKWCFSDAGQMYFNVKPPVVLAAVHSKAVVLLLLIYFFRYLPNFCGECVLVFVLVCITLCPFYKVCNHIDEEERAGCLLLLSLEKS